MTRGWPAAEGRQWRRRESTQAAITVTMLDELYPADRLVLAAAAAARAGLDALLLTPGPDLRYVIGYDAHADRTADLPGDAGRRAAFLVVPRLELPAAQASPAGRLGLELVPWDETDDPYALVAGRLGARTRSASPTGCGP